MRLDLSDWVDQHIFATGEYESDVSAVARALLKEGDMAIDIGANVGFFSLLFGKLVGKTGKVFAFEPQPRVFQRLRANMALNDLPQVVAFEKVIADKRGDATFFCGPSDHSGIASLRQIDESSCAVAVAAVTLDEMLVPTSSVRLIKIDIEGAEYRAIEGMQRTLRTHHPDLIIEVTDRFLRDMGSSARELCNRLSGWGYKPYMIGWQGVEPLDQWDGVLPSQFNGFFTARDSLPQSIARLHL